MATKSELVNFLRGEGEIELNLAKRVESQGGDATPIHERIAKFKQAADLLCDAGLISSEAGTSHATPPAGDSR